MLTCIDVKFILDSVRLGLSSSANILQIVGVTLELPVNNVFYMIFRLLLRSS